MIYYMETPEPWLTLRYLHFYRKHSTERLKLAYLLIYPLKSV